MKGINQIKNVKGFTLIELMIVVAIIGILAAIALPAYQDYTGKAQASEAVSLAAAAKTEIASFYQSEGNYPTTASTPKAADLAVTGTYGTLAVTPITGAIIVTMNSTGVTADLRGKKITMTPSIANGAFKWTCTTDIVKKNLNPKNCT
ncbi:pilin [Shewanella sp. AC91-MNA-CIBAN-0169]|jgi:type IV pilus assembly protein PilA|uniref:pilin n=1 Tax=Shewanella sp. AC91-MNA-CIBAN-0169 TaxID=3140466 RepID=UPI003323A6E0